MQVTRKLIKFIPAVLEMSEDEVGIRLISNGVRELIDQCPNKTYNISIGATGLIDLTDSSQVPFNVVVNKNTLSPGILSWMNQGFPEFAS